MCDKAKYLNIWVSLYKSQNRLQQWMINNENHNYNVSDSAKESAKDNDNDNDNDDAAQLCKGGIM